MIPLVVHSTTYDLIFLSVVARLKNAKILQACLRREARGSLFSFFHTDSEVARRLITILEANSKKFEKYFVDSTDTLFSRSITSTPSPKNSIFSQILKSKTNNNLCHQTPNDRHSEHIFINARNEDLASLAFEEPEDDYSIQSARA